MPLEMKDIMERKAELKRKKDQEHEQRLARLAARVNDDDCDMRFVAGAPWIRKPVDRGCKLTLVQREELGVELFDYLVCPIYMFIDGLRYDFVTDVVLGERPLCLYEEPMDSVHIHANLIAEALTIAARDRQWRVRNFCYLSSRAATRKSEEH